MRPTRRGWHLSMCLGTCALWLLTVPVLLPASVMAQSQSEVVGASRRDGADRFPNDDAVFLRYAQDWTLDRDGAVHYREQWSVKLRNNRPIDRFGDPRIAHLRGDDTLVIREAKAVLLDGSVLKVPDYSLNLAATDAVAGWPEYSGWQDMIVSFSGIEPGVVLHLDYEVISPAGTLPWLEGQVRLTDRYPIVDRFVRVTVPEGTTLHYRLDAGSEAIASPEERSTGGNKTYRWMASNLPGENEEPLSPPWSILSPRLRFSTCPDVSTWAFNLLARVDRAAAPDKAIEAFARSAVENETDPAERIRKVAEKLGNTFNFVESPKALRSLSCRDAGQVYQSNYGNGLEAGSLLLAAVRSLGLDASPILGVKADEWAEADGLSPTLSSFDGSLARVSLPAGAVYLHPRYGEIKDPGTWGRRWLLGIRDGQFESVRVKARGEGTVSEVQVTGKVSLGKDGRASGELRVQASGAYFDPDKIRNADAQKSWAAALVAQVLSGFDVSSLSIVTLSDDTVRAMLQVATTNPLPKLGGRYVLRFGDGPALPQALTLPLERSERTTAVRIGTRIREVADLTVELPEGWKPEILPGSLELVSGAWGSASQHVSKADRTLRLARSVTIDRETLSPSEFLEARGVLNALRANKHLVAALQE